MKTTLRLLFFLLLVNAGLTGTAQCVAPSFAYNIQPGGVVSFTNYSFYADSNVGATVIAWNFGDGDTVHNSNYQVNHTYTSSGTFTVSLEISNSSLGCDSTESETITLNLCQGGALFTTAQTGFGDYTFTPVNLGALTGATVLWNFGDGNTSTTASPSHHFTTNGYDNVTLTVTDASLSCTETDTNGLNVNVCSYPGSIDTTILGGNPIEVGFTTSLTNAGYTYAWAFGDMGIASGASVTHTFYTSATYTVSVTVSDAVTGCSATVTKSLGIDRCNLNISFGNFGNGLVQEFDAYSWDSLNAVISSYSWSFPGATPATGSGSTVTGVTYPSTGTYSACVYLVTSNGCLDTLCKSVVISAPLYSISGTVSKSSGSGFAGVVYLIRQDSIGHLVLIDSSVSVIDSTGGFGYNFYGLPVDTYFVKAALDTNDADYASYLPTYYGTVLTWGTATPVGITNSNVSGIDIPLIAGINSGGPGFVGGYVSQGAGLVIGNAGNGYAKALGDPISGVQVNLLTSANQAVAYTFTDASGHYKFANLALGTYKIYVEQLNKIPTPLNFTLTAENPVDSGADMSINSHGTTGIGNVGDLQVMEVYPNPVINNVQVQITCKQDADATLKVVDVSGRTNIEQKVKLLSGQNTTEVNMAGFAAGVYQLVIETNGQQIAYKLVKAK